MSYPIEYLIYRPIIALFVGKISGKENIPKDKSFIAAANHSSYLDDVLLPYTAFICTKKNFRIFINSRFYKNPLIRAYLNHYDHIPVDAGKDIRQKQRREETNKKAFEKALQTLKEGKIFLIFPEGGRSDNGKIRKAKTGIARIALLSKAPVIPIGIIGSYKIWPKGKMFPRPGRAEINIGKPIYFNKFYSKPITKKLLKTATGQIMGEISRLAGQRYKP